MNISSVFHIVLGLYALATLVYLLRLIFGIQKLSAIALRMTILAALAQTMVLGWHLYRLPPGVPFGFLEYFQVSSLTLAVIFVGLCFFKRFYGAGPLFILPIDLFFIFSLTSRSSSLELYTGHGARYLYIHLLCIFLSLAIFSIALVTALMFLLSEWQIKQKRFDGIVSRFPSLTVLNDIHYRTMYAGFVLFTFAILTGAGYSKMVHHHYLTEDLKQILSILSWIFFAIILNFRVRQGWQGHKGILLSLVGFAGIFFSFLLGLA